MIRIVSRKIGLPLAVVVVVGCATVPRLVPAETNVKQVAADIAYHGEQIKTLSARQQNEISGAREETKRWEQSAEAWHNDYDDLNNSVPVWIGWIIWAGFKWWLLAVIIAFVARMVFVWVGGPIGELGAHLCTSILGVLTCFCTYLANIPDNLYFQREIAKRDATISELQAQLHAAQLAQAAIAGATPVMPALTAAGGVDPK